ncbi:MAG TPA: hypothetical protein HA272_02385, partial [Methanoregula sp.]|nr:hypothetical protein [Methanoregula sp.]
EEYGLSDIHLYRSDTEIAAICLRTFPLRRLEKIIKASGSANYGSLLKYKQLFFRVGEKHTGAGQVSAGPPVFEKTIRAPEKNNAHFISRPHHTFLSGFIHLADYPRMHGEGGVFLTHTIIEDE